MRKLPLLGTMLLPLTGFVANAQAQAPVEAPEHCSVHVITTLYPSYDFVRNIGGKAVCATLLLKPGQEAHTYEPSPGDIRKIAKSNLFVYVGGDNDEWVENLLKNLGKKAPKSVSLISLVPTVNEEHVEGMEPEEEEHDHDHGEKTVAAHDEHDHDHDHDHAKADEHDHDHAKGEEEEEEVDEHVWLSPYNAQLIVEGLTKELISMDPKDKALFEANSAAYIKKLQVLDQAFMKVVQNSKNKTLVFGDRFPFRYFVDRYGLKYYAAFPGCSAQVQASAGTLAFLSNKAKELKAPVVLELERSNGRIAKTVAHSCGAKVETFHAIHNLSADEIKRGEDYLSLMTKNVEVLKRALQ